MSYLGVNQQSPISYFLDILLRNMSEGVLFINPDGLFLAINPKAEALLEKQAKDLLLQSFWEFFSDQSFGFSMREALEKEDWHQEPFQVSWKDRYLQITSHKYLANGPVCGMLLFLQDVTNQTHNAHRLQRKSRLEELGEMSTVVAHEIKNPLGGIRGYAMLLQRKLQDSSLETMACRIVEGTVTLDALLTKILQFVKPSELSLEKTNITQLAEKTLTLACKDSLLSQNITCKTHLPIEPVYAWVDPSLLERALLNVFINGLQAMQKGGELSLSVLQQVSHCIITIADTGCGICEATQKEMFSPFFTTKKEGYGLGLSETHKIVKEHEGSLDVRTTLGKGAVFSITLPLKRSL